MKLRKIKGNILLLAASIIWGLAFVMQSDAADKITPFTLNATRALLASLALLPVILFMKKNKGKTKEEIKLSEKRVWLAGIECGVLLYIAVNLQQYGIALYPADAAVSARSGFITALYVIIVPLLGIFGGKKIKFLGWLGVALAVVGMYFLCFAGPVSGGYFADIVMLLCALAFSLQILCINHYGDTVDGIKLSAIEFLSCGTLSLISAFIFEEPSVDMLYAALPCILYLAFLSSGIGYTFQIIGQQLSGNPSVSSIIMSLESVFAAIGGVVIMKKTLSVWEIIGCTVMFAATIIAQIPDMDFKNKV